MAPASLIHLMRILPEWLVVEEAVSGIGAAFGQVGRSWQDREEGLRRDPLARVGVLGAGGEIQRSKAASVSVAIPCIHDNNLAGE